MKKKLPENSIKAGEAFTKKYSNILKLTLVPTLNMNKIFRIKTLIGFH